MASYTFNDRGWYEKTVELATIRSVEVAPPLIPDYPREVGKAWPLLNVDMKSWRIVAYEEPPAPIEVKQTGISKAAFVRLFGAEKFAQIIQATQTDIEVKAAYEYASLCDIVELDHPDTITYLGLLGVKGILTTEQIQKISTNQPIW